MRRREFLKTAAKTAAVGAASTVFSAPAIVRAQVRWQMATSWPVSLDTIYGGAQIFAERVAELTEGAFIIEPQPAHVAWYDRLYREVYLSLYAALRETNRRLAGIS